MAAQEATHQKISVFHQFDGVRYQLIFSDPDTGATLIGLAMETEQMVEFVSTIVSTLVEKSDV